MSTIAVTNVKHPSAVDPAIVLDADGNATVAGMGLVLVKPTSIANSGGSASVSGGQVSFTGVSSVSLNGVFSSAYNNYKVLLEGFGTDFTYDIRCRMRASGTDATGANYNSGHVYITSSSGPSRAYYPGETSGFFASVSTNALSADVTMFNPNLAKRTTAITNSMLSDLYVFAGASSHNLSTGYDGITIFPALGTITGTIRVYGYRNS